LRCDYSVFPSLISFLFVTGCYKSRDAGFAAALFLPTSSNNDACPDHV
jgi:hypothetical protein